MSSSLEQDGDAEQELDDAEDHHEDAHIRREDGSGFFKRYVTENIVFALFRLMLESIVVFREPRRGRGDHAHINDVRVRKCRLYRRKVDFADEKFVLQGRHFCLGKLDVRPGVGVCLGIDAPQDELMESLIIEMGDLDGGKSDEFLDLVVDIFLGKAAVRESEPCRAFDQRKVIVEEEPLYEGRWLVRALEGDVVKQLLHARVVYIGLCEVGVLVLHVIFDERAAVKGNGFADGHLEGGRGNGDIKVLRAVRYDGHEP